MKQEETRNNQVATVENVNVVINFESPASREAEASARKERETEADNATAQRKTAQNLMQTARENYNKLVEAEKVAKLKAARSRYAAGEATTSDNALLACDTLQLSARYILEAAAKQRAALEATPEAVAATKAIRDNNKSKSLSRACNCLVEDLALYNAKFSIFGFQLEAADVTPALMKADNVSAFLLAPTADGEKVATIARGKLKVVTDWSAAKLADVLIDNATITAAVEAAPAAAILSALNARDNVAALEAEAVAIDETLKDRRNRASQLKRTINNPRAAAATKATAAAQLEALNGEIATYETKATAAADAIREAKATAAKLHAVALEAAEISESDMKQVENRRDDVTTAKAESETATRRASLAINTAASIAASALRKAKKVFNFEAIRKADPVDVFKTDAPEATRDALQLIKATAPADFEKAQDAVIEAGRKRAELEQRRNDEADEIKAGAKADPTAKYKALLKIACDALKAARDAKAKKDKAADPQQTPEISESEFINIVDEADKAEATAAAVLETFNEEATKAIQTQEAARAENKPKRQPRRARGRNSKPAEAPAVAVA